MRRLEDNPTTATPELGNLKSFYRCEFFKFIDFLISTLGEKYQSLASVFQPFLKVIDPKTPSNMVDTTTLVHHCPLYSHRASRQPFTINSKSSFSISMNKEALEEFDKGGKPHSEISEAANVALKLTRQHGLFKYVSRVYQLCLTAAPSVCKNENFQRVKKSKKLSSQQHDWTTVASLHFTFNGKRLDVSARSEGIGD